ncbi:hypothetical protein [Aromatoleum evansii]|uniref:hypothetical protein n=1 Tax=Aromatoleum evansii TaxID=59406 RepID=UPI00145EB5B5|nr:hypothetical protein [Aromatoleum evansii]NMG28418.1 hypothetical protein [Aromatoleum evansii]
MVGKHWTVEILAADGRKRKYHEPLFVTPDGLLEGFPEVEHQLFVSADEAQAALVRSGYVGVTSVRTVSLPTLFRTARYKRWAAEVKPMPEGERFVEPRLSLEDAFALYQNGGREALRQRYTRTHVAQLMARFRKEGWLSPEAEEHQ